jgi:hypothetical protein
MHFSVTPRSVYLRDEADKCRRRANAQSDHETQAELRKLADQYEVRAAQLESKVSFS